MKNILLFLNEKGIKLNKIFMSANLILLPRKEFELILSDGTVVKGKFGTWSLKRFGEKKNMGLKQVMECFSVEMTLGDMIEFILCAVEYMERLEKKPLSFNDLRLCEWIDDYTADTNEFGVITKLFTHSSSEDNEAEKKTLTGEETTSTTIGEPSKELHTQPV